MCVRIKLAFDEISVENIPRVMPVFYWCISDGFLGSWPPLFPSNRPMYWECAHAHVPWGFSTRNNHTSTNQWTEGTNDCQADFGEWWTVKQTHTELLWQTCYSPWNCRKWTHGSLSSTAPWLKLKRKKNTYEYTMHRIIPVGHISVHLELNNRHFKNVCPLCLTLYICSVCTRVCVCPGVYVCTCVFVLASLCVPVFLRVGVWVYTLCCQRFWKKRVWKNITYPNA